MTTTHDSTICNYPRKIKASELERILRDKNVQDKDVLISIIEHRLSRRFVKTIDNANEKDLSSFMSMAICCLIIETLECFYLGLPDTKKSGEGARVFKSFFNRSKGDFPGFFEKSKDFYENVRCGLLHQAETMNGWFLKRSGQIIEASGNTKFINGKLFFESTKKSIEKYLSVLKDSNFDDDIWEKAFDKLKQILDNCNEIKKYP